MTITSADFIGLDPETREEVLAEQQLQMEMHRETMEDMEFSEEEIESELDMRFG